VNWGIIEAIASVVGALVGILALVVVLVQWRAFRKWFTSHVWEAAFACGVLAVLAAGALILLGELGVIKPVGLGVLRVLGLGGLIVAIVSAVLHVRAESRAHPTPDVHLLHRRLTSSANSVQKASGEDPTSTANERHRTRPSEDAIGPQPRDMADGGEP
jgi:hypothetical protein